MEMNTYIIVYPKGEPKVFEAKLLPEEYLDDFNQLRVINILKIKKGKLYKLWFTLTPRLTSNWSNIADRSDTHYERDYERR